MWVALITLPDIHEGSTKVKYNVLTVRTVNSLNGISRVKRKEETASSLSCHTPAASNASARNCMLRYDTHRSDARNDGI